jgi:hypothetical protein
LVTAEHVYDVVVHHDAERLVEPRRHPAPADGLQLGVETGNPPHVALDRADRGVAIREKAVAAEEHERAPRVFEWRRDRVDGVRRARAGRARGRERLRPLGRTALHEVGERMLFSRRDLADDHAILCPGSV